MLLHKVPFDWKQRAVLQGRGFHVDVGAFSTPIQGGGVGTTILIDEPEASISVPTGTSILPIRIHVQCQVPILAADSEESEILLAVDIASAHAGDGTATAETALPMYMGNGTSLCTCTSATTSAITDPVLGWELAHKVKLGDYQGTPAAVMWTDLELLYTPSPLPVLVGPCALYLYWGGTVAVTGFAQIEWLEYLTSDL